MRLPCQALDISVATIERVRQHFVEPGLAPALGRKQPLQHPSRALDGEQEAHLIAIACSAPPCRPQSLESAVTSSTASELRVRRNHLS